MKPSLERTAVLSKDLTEQEDSQYIIMIPDVNIVLATDGITHENGEVHVHMGSEQIASFSDSLTWMCISRSRVEVVKREDQLRRHVENVKSEKELMETIAPEMAEEAKKMAKLFDDKPEAGTGLYL